MEETLGILIFLFFGLFWLAMIALSIGSFVLWIIALIDVSKREFKQENDKTLWLLVILLGGGIGAIVYYFVVMRNPENYTKIVKNN